MFQTPNRYLFAVLALCLSSGVVMAADRKPADQFPEYRLKHLSLKTGCKLVIVDGERLVRAIVPDQEGAIDLQLEATNSLQKFVSTVNTVEQAQELCELLIFGAVVEDEKTYNAIRKIHEQAGYKQAVKDERMTFKQVANEVEGGFTIAFTAFHDAGGIMGDRVIPRAVCKTERLEFFVGKDASVRVMREEYLPGPALSWQTDRLDTEKARKEQSRRVFEVQQLQKACYEQCKIKLPKVGM